MDLNKINAKLAELDAEEQAARAAAEAEANKSVFERITETGTELLQTIGEGMMMQADADLERSQIGIQLAGQAVDFTKKTAADIYTAYNDLGTKRQEFLSRGADLAAQYTPEALQQAQETGDYSAQQSAIGSAQTSAEDTVTATRNLTLSPVREAAREFISAYSQDNDSAFQSLAQGMERSDANIEYFMTDAERMNKARTMADATGIPTEAILSDNDAYKQALDVYNYQQKVAALGGSLADVWREYPELQNIADMNKDDAAVALHYLHDIRSTHGIIDTFSHMLERGNKELEYNNLQYKIMTGKADENDRARAADLKLQIDADRRKAPSFLDDPAAAIAAGVAQSAPEMWQSIITAADDAAIAASVAMVAGAAVGSAAGGLGAAPGALLGGTTGFAGGFIRSLIANAGQQQLIRAAAGAGARVGAFTGMARPEIGSRYAEYGELTDAEGKPLLTDDQRRLYATVGGSANALVEVANFGLVAKQLRGLPYASTVFGDIIAETGARATAYEASKKLIADKVADTFKITLSESAEEGLQSITDDMVHNRIVLDTGAANLKEYSASDMAARAMSSSLEAIPGSIGFGLAGAGGGMLSASYKISRAHKAEAKFITDYGEQAKQTITGTIMLERLQQAVSENKMKEKAPDVQKKVLRTQLNGTGYENAYVDVEMALKKENGMDDLKKLAESANISTEELESAVEQQGHLMVPTEVFAQAATTPELLESVSFAPEAESLSRMKENAASAIKEVKSKTESAITKQIALMDTIADEYFPVDKDHPENRSTRDALLAAMYYNPENPAKGWQQFRSDEQARLDEILAPAYAALASGRGGVKNIEVEDWDGRPTYIRLSENDEWYRDFYKEHKRPPTKAELQDIAVAITTADPSAPNVIGFTPTTREEAEAMAESGAEIQRIMDNLSALDSIKSVAKGLSGVEMRLTEGLSKEGYKVYREVADELKRAGGSTARTARMNAVLFARHADIVAKIISDKTGKKYTALDYKRERYGLDVNGKYQGTLHQGLAFSDMPIEEVERQIGAKNELLNAEPVVTITSNPFQNVPQKEIKNYFRQKYQKINEQTGRAEPFIAYTKYGEPIKLTVNGTYKEIIRHSADNRILALLPHLEEIIGNSVLLYDEKPIASRIKKLNQTTLSYKQYGCKARFNEQDVFVRSTIRRATDGSYYYDLNIDNYATKKKDPSANGEPDHNSGSFATNPSKSALIISDWIKNVNLLEAEKARWENAITIPAGVVKKTEAQKPIAAAVAAFRDKYPNGATVDTQIGTVKINTHSIKDSLSHGIYQAKMDVVPYLKEGMENAELLGRFDDFDGKTIKNHFFAFPIRYNNENHYVVCRVRDAAGGDKRLYIHDVFSEERIKQKSQSIQTQPIPQQEVRQLRGPALYSYILADFIARNNSEVFNQEANQSGIKGSIGAMADGRRIISIFETADESTFAHEMSHMFLMDLEDLARIDDTSAKELEIVNSWAEWEKGAAKEYRGTPWAKEFAQREQEIVDAEAAGDHDTAERLKRVWRQERFARAFELYLRDGKAPAKGLKEVFRKFKKFLRAIYTAFTGDGGKPSLQVQRIMDRMIATEDEIAAAELDDRYKDVTKAGGEKLLTETEEETYKRWYTEASEEAKERLLAETMKELEGKKLEEFNTRIARERARKEKELQQETAYLAYRAVQESGDINIVLNWYDSVESFLKEADEIEPLVETLDSYMEEYTKALDAELIESYLSEEAVSKAMETPKAHTKLEAYKASIFAAKEQLVRKIDRKSEYAMQSVEERIQALPEDVELKLDRQEEMVKALMKALARLKTSTKWTAKDHAAIEKMVRSATKAEMSRAFKEFQDKLKEEQKVDKANLQAVMEANEGKLGIFRDRARELILTKPLAEACNYQGYIREAKKKAGHVQTMIRAKNWTMAVKLQNQVAMANAMAVEAKKMQEHVQKRLNDIKRKLNVKSVHLPKDERYWLRHLAYVLRITPTDAKKPQSGVMDLDVLIDEMVEGLDVQYRPLDILHIAQENEDFNGYRSLMVGTFDDAIEALQMLYTTGRNKFSLLSNSVDGKEIADIIDEIGNDLGMAANISRERHQIQEDSGGLAYSDTLAKIPGIGSLLAKAGQKGMAASMNIELILKVISPTAHKYIYGIYERAAADESARMAREIGIMKDLLAPFSHKERREWKEQKYTITTGRGQEKITKENIICMALNVGNDGNLHRMIDGLFPESPEGSYFQHYQEIMEFLGEHMTTKDWKLVQDIWDHLNEYWKETVEVEERLNGVTLKKVEARSVKVVASDGTELTLKGGYYPVVFNPEKSSKAAEQDVNKALQSSMSGAQVLGTNRGFTQSRTEATVRRPLLFEFGTIPDHLTNVIHNISYRIPARDVYRLINNLEFERIVTDSLGQDYHRLLKQWATDAWNMPKDSSNMATSMLDRVVSAFRRNSVMSIMGYRLWPVIENVSNIGAIMDHLGAFKGLTAVATFYASYKENKRLLRKSVFMQNRIDSLDRDIRGQEGLFNADPLPFEIIRSHAYDFMLYSDLALSMPTWVQAYKDSYAEKLGEVQRENLANIQRIEAADARLKELKAKALDNEKLATDIENHLNVRQFGTPEEIAAERESSPFAVMKPEELRAEAGEARNRNKAMDKELWEAEVEYEKATRIEILDDTGVLEEAEWRAVAEADKAIRRTFGSGRTIDQASIQRGRNEFTKLMTTFYSFFNTQFNAIYEQYLESKFSDARRAQGTIKRWAPWAKSIMYRIVLVSIIGYTLKFALGLEGGDDKDKFRKVKGEDGEEHEEEIPTLERYMKGVSKYILSTAAGGFVGIRDLANLALNYAFDGTVYGQSYNPTSTATRSLQELGKTFSLLASKGERNLAIDEKLAKREKTYQDRLKKLKGKKREEAIRKHEEDEKYRKPEKRITYSEIARHAGAAASSLPGIGAAYTGLTSTLVDSITTTMMYLNDDDNRYDPTFKNIVWSAIFDKKPVEREVPKRPPKQADSGEKKKKK